MKTEDLVRLYILGQIAGGATAFLALIGLVAWAYFGGSNR